MTAAAVIVVSDVRKRYGPIEALRGVSLTVRRGEIFGLLGPNGAGKTTLIKSLVGSTRPTSGTVRVMGLDPRGQAPALRRQIGYMPQAPALYEDLSPRHNLQFFGRGHGVPDLERRIDAVVDLVGLRERQHGAVYGFSGGMKQRLSLDCALVHEPRVLFLDEPTAGVDPRLRETFWGYFRTLAAQGVTLVVSTHQMDEAMFCERLAVLRAGEVLACESPRELLGRGRARVRLWYDGRAEDVTLPAGTQQLAGLLHRHGLDPAVTRIELEQDSLETIVLDLIASRERRAESADAHD
jgi:ABC-2 type transport system ATP-binding protein